MEEKNKIPILKNFEGEKIERLENLRVNKRERNVNRCEVKS